MSLLTALSSGTSGIEANSNDLSVIGDNIANANTVGFKMSRSDFESQLSQSLLGGGSVGDGVQMTTVQQIITQGSLTQTGNSTDMALQGNGMFIVSGKAGGGGGDLYTRDGQFNIDKSGYLVTQSGNRVQGYSADASGGIQNTVGDMQVGNATVVATPTGTIQMKGTLDPNAAILTPDITSSATAAATSNVSQAVTIYDSTGAAHAATVYFNRTGTGAWNYNVLTDAGGNGGQAGTPVSIASGSMTFDNTGKLSADPTETSNFTPTNAAAQTLKLNFGTPTSTAGGSGTDGLTSSVTATTGTAGTSSSINYASADGHQAGTLTSVAVGADGTITGTFSNGVNQAVGQVAIAEFAAPDQLKRLGANLYAATPNDAVGGANQAAGGSGDALVGKAGDAGRGTIAAGALEQSNVDITNQFVNMIAAQRDFEANSKTVTTADQMLNDLIQMKR